MSDYSEPTASSSGFSVDAVGSWVLAKAGQALDVAIDRKRNEPQQIENPSRAYGVGADGKLYAVGQPTFGSGPGTSGVSTGVLLIGAALLAIVAFTIIKK